MIQNYNVQNVQEFKYQVHKQTDMKSKSEEYFSEKYHGYNILDILKNEKSLCIKDKDEKMGIMKDKNRK